MNAGFGVKTAAPKAGSRKPPIPESIEETGLLDEAISDLIIKTLYTKGALTGQELSEAVCLPFRLLDDLYHDLQHRQFLEVRGTQGHGRGGYVYDLTGQGRDRAREAMISNQYVGPAPVPIDVYRTWVEAQTIRKVHITVDRIQSGFGHLVLDPAFIEHLGPAINSAKSMFLYGDSGNGKTNMAESIARMLGGDMYVPYAVDIEGQIMITHDPVYHRPKADEAVTVSVDGEESTLLESAPTYDRRFARVARPVVFTGGELTLEQLDLQYDPTAKVYQAPFQVKANGGVLIIDDFGRQQVRPRDLLNRWIVPLEKRIDFMTLHTGHKFPVPFDCLLIFATNLNPLDLVDEAFLRRIHYKIHVPSPDYEQFVQIFRRVCVSRQIPFVAGRVAYIYRQYYEPNGISPRSCHPRDIVDHLCDSARYLGTKPELTVDLLDHACKSYFLDMPDEDYVVDPLEFMGDQRAHAAAAMAMTVTHGGSGHGEETPTAESVEAGGAEEVPATEGEPVVATEDEQGPGQPPGSGPAP
jgi:hypothetical protein